MRYLLDTEETPFGAYDLQIAARVMSLRLTLVTNNVREFSRIPSLRMENWVD
jgi:tRNA(fMet)-specific endonuclease VapC